MMVTMRVRMVSRGLLLTVLVISLVAFAVAIQSPSSVAHDTATAKGSVDDPSGMYSFLRDGEFVQLTLDDGKLSGYISRFGDSESDKGTFIDQFFDKASLSGDRLSFKTKTVHGVWYEFSGVVATTPGKQPAQEGYWVIKGTLIQHAVDASGADKPRRRQMEMKSFPQDLSKP